MEVAIIVIAAFIVLLLLIIAAVRMCIKYHCINFCDQDVESIDDHEILGDVDESDSLDDEDPNCEEILNDALDADMDSGKEDGGEEALNGVDLSDVISPHQGHCLCDSDQCAMDCEGDEYINNSLRESLL